MTTSTSTNLAHAARLRDRARQHPGGTAHRAALLCAAVALAETRTLNGARKLLAHERLDDTIRDRAHQLLNELTPETT
jgi:hypothetical protein